MKVNIRLRVLRAERGLSQMETAMKAGLAENKYWRIENGYADPSDDEKNSIARALGVTVDEAFSEQVAS